MEPRATIQDFRTSEPGRRPKRSRRESLPRLRRLLQAAAILLVVAGGVAALWEGYRRVVRLPYFRVTEVRVEGNLQVPETDIVASLGLDYDSNILELDLPDLSRRVLQNPWIREASVRRQLPLSLTIRVVERVPEAVFIAGRRYLLSADGVILAALDDGELPTLPTLRSALPRPVGVGERVLSSEMAQGLSVWRQFQMANALQGERAHEIAMATDGSYLVNLGQEMPVIRLHARGLEEQLRRLGAALAASGQGLGTFAEVDLRFRDRVVFRPVKGG
ncbi:MAG: FtsQ-type POTRA domain-containing protein [candidate division NC10 bacterium]|nr:FtsQ-type POTRA domain-containing protein [candidate division NC10 bacterium]